MDGNGTPAKSLEERKAAAIARQQELVGTISMLGKPVIPDVLTAIARLRVIRALVINAGLVVDLETGLRPLEEEAEELFDALEAEAKAEVFQDIVDALTGKPNAHARQILPTATSIEKSH